MERPKSKGPRAGATARRARVVVLAKPTRPHTATDLPDQIANARDWLARRHRVLSPWSRLASSEGAGRP